MIYAPEDVFIVAGYFGAIGLTLIYSALSGSNYRTMNNHSLSISMRLTLLWMGTIMSSGLYLWSIRRYGWSANYSDAMNFIERGSFLAKLYGVMYFVGISTVALATAITAYEIVRGIYRRRAIRALLVNAQAHSDAHNGYFPPEFYRQVRKQRE